MWPTSELDTARSPGDQPDTGEEDLLLVARVLHVGAAAGSITDMARISVTLDDGLIEAVKAAAGDRSASAWVADLIRRAMLERASRAAAAYDLEHDDADHEAARLAGAA